MMYGNFLNDILGQKSKLKALRFLAVYKKEVSIRELAREIKITTPNLSRILNELENQGVLVSRRIGTSIVFSLNRGHFLAEEIIDPLFKKEKEVRTELGRNIVKKFYFPYESAILFGSIARKQEHPRSDIDLAVIISGQSNTSDIENKILKVNPAITKKFGNSLSPIVIRKSDFKKRFKVKDKLVISIAKEGLPIAGKTISQLIV